MGKKRKRERSFANRGGRRAGAGIASSLMAKEEGQLGKTGKAFHSIPNKQEGVCADRCGKKRRWELRLTSKKTWLKAQCEDTKVGHIGCADGARKGGEPEETSLVTISRGWKEEESLRNCM